MKVEHHAALSAVQRQVMTLARNGTNPHFGSGYTTLEALTEATRPVLLEAGIVVLQSPGYEAEGGIVTLTTTLVFNDGETLVFTAGAPVQQPNPQGVGSAITYLRRYSMMSLLGLASEDDDGNAASTKPEPLTVSSKINFGKYKGETFEAIAVRDPDYLEWVASNANTPEVREAAGEALQNRQNGPESAQAVRSWSETMKALQDPKKTPEGEVREIQRQHRTAEASERAEQVEEETPKGPDAPWGIGKHKKVLTKDLDQDYLNWAVEGLSNPKKRDEAKAELERRGMERMNRPVEPLNDFPEALDEDDDLPF